MYNDSNELYHHGVMGMHWGVRRYQPYRKGDKVKGGKEIGKATKVEQRPIGERIKKVIASMNKIKKEIHKGSEEKAEYKFKMAQLKAAKKEVKKAQRREKEERIRERIREHREEQRMERQEAEERRERNWQRARDIANDAATIGTMLYGAYQLKKSMQGERGIGGGSSSSGSSPSITTSGSSSGSRNRLTSYTPPGAHSPATPSITRSGSGGSSPSTHSFSSNRAVRSEAARAQRNSITNSINSAVTKLKNKQNKTDADRYALISLAAFKNRVSSSSDDDAMKMVNLTPDELIQRYTHRDRRLTGGGYAYHADDHSDYLKHHGIMGMHWGIRRFQPYRKGERVRGGKEVGKATKVEQRQDTNAKRSISSKILALTNKTERDWARKVKADKKRQKEGLYDSDTPEYKAERERVTKGGVSKEYDAATKRLRDAEERYRKNPSVKTYRAIGDAENAQVEALNRHLEKSGIQKYSDNWLNNKINSSSARYNELKKKLDKFDRKHGDKTSQEYYDREIAGRSTERNHKGKYVDKKRREYERLKAERNQLERPTNTAKLILDTWESERTKNGSLKNVRAQNDSKNFLVKNGISPKVASKVVANKSLDELADMMKDAYKDPSLLRTAKKMTPDELERHLYG